MTRILGESHSVALEFHSSPKQFGNAGMKAGVRTVGFAFVFAAFASQQPSNFVRRNHSPQKGEPCAQPAHGPPIGHPSEAAYMAVESLLTTSLNFCMRL